MPIKILFIGDIIGKPGRQALSRELDRLVDRHNVDLVIANGENTAGGFGLTAETAKELFSQGIHLLDQRQPHLGQEGAGPAGAGRSAYYPPGQLSGRRSRQRQRNPDHPRRGQGRRTQSGGAGLHENPGVPFSGCRPRNRASETGNPDHIC